MLSSCIYWSLKIDPSMYLYKFLLMRHFKISSGLLYEYKRLIGWICSLIIITPTWITSPRTMRIVPHVTKTCALIYPSEFYVILICTISPPIYHLWELIKHQKWFFGELLSISTTNLIHHQHFMAMINMRILVSFFNSYQHVEPKTWYYVSHSCNP